ncbi:hypothetical protein NE237_008859 [Protea cynaroides]|uniref:Uncharacterized protein n=1 Tax=Protea cynaroides TaxID=273540 RepID=A0A9Q0KWU9_9MAGN|nr:hypothetical protein NE237_008859 [Protea cynaroides]
MVMATVRSLHIKSATFLPRTYIKPPPQHLTTPTDPPLTEEPITINLPHTCSHKPALHHDHLPPTISSPLSILKHQHNLILPPSLHTCSATLTNSPADLYMHQTTQNLITEHQFHTSCSPNTPPAIEPTPLSSHSHASTCQSIATCCNTVIPCCTPRAPPMLATPNTSMTYTTLE